MPKNTDTAEYLIDEYSQLLDESLHGGESTPATYLDTRNKVTKFAEKVGHSVGRVLTGCFVRARTNQPMPWESSDE